MRTPRQLAFSGSMKIIGNLFSALRLKPFEKICSTDKPIQKQTMPMQSLKNRFVIYHIKNT